MRDYYVCDVFVLFKDDGEVSRRLRILTIVALPSLRFEWNVLSLGQDGRKGDAQRRILFVEVSW